jgi:hypothetical protein
VLGTYYLYCEGDAPLLFTENSSRLALRRCLLKALP